MRVLQVAILLLVTTPVALAETTTVDVILRDEDCPAGPDRFCIEPSTLRTAREDELVLRVTNEGRVLHNLTFPASMPEALRQHGMKEALDPGGEATIRIPWSDLGEALDDQDAATFTLWCGVRGHEALGMTATLAVGDATDEEERSQPFVPVLFMLAILGLAVLIWKRRR